MHNISITLNRLETITKTEASYLSYRTELMADFEKYKADRIKYHLDMAERTKELTMETLNLMSPFGGPHAPHNFSNDFEEFLSDLRGLTCETVTLSMVAVERLVNGKINERETLGDRVAGQAMQKGVARGYSEGGSKRLG